ncbi:LOW QUALITY PROTEIN: coiled-coil domain-containing protein 42 [Falco rusticolus]|uniref:LOW QUALITY PROTEIN: coiled-coil domain-containing protein 42 n=1 Tax=Falco rusticolus TaxID=120794 RepID=UPI000FFBA47B|nr:LOW QUALITY PROTEIN: coiled-coil domain-containing protein 42 [Falco rusticolus]
MGNSQSDWEVSQCFPLEVSVSTYSLCAGRTWALSALLVAGGMATVDKKELLDYFSMQYRQSLLPMLRTRGLSSEDAVSLFVYLQKKRREARLMQNALEEKKEAFKERMKAIACRWRGLHIKEAQLKNYKNKFRKFLKENDKKRIQALQKAIGERETKIQKESELLEAKRQLEILKNKHQKLCNKVQKYSIFTKYLEDVVKVSQFEEIQEVIWRYRTLVMKHKDLLQSQQRCKEMSKQAKVFLDHYTAEKEAEILQYENELVQLQLYLDQVQKDVLSWEAFWADLQSIIVKEALRLRHIKVGIHSLFQLANMQLNLNLNVPADDSHRQLTMVEPSQTLLPARSGAVMTLSCPKGGESPVKLVCPAATFLFTWALSWIQQLIQDLRDISMEAKQKKV